MTQIYYENRLNQMFHQSITQTVYFIKTFIILCNIPEPREKYTRNFNPIIGDIIFNTFIGQTFLLWQIINIYSFE